MPSVSALPARTGVFALHRGSTCMHCLERCQPHTTCIANTEQSGAQAVHSNAASLLPLHTVRTAPHDLAKAALRNVQTQTLQGKIFKTQPYH